MKLPNNLNRYIKMLTDQKNCMEGKDINNKAGTGNGPIKGLQSVLIPYWL